jgi:hypothetical protein
MRHWGLVIGVCYALLAMLLFAPGISLLFGDPLQFPDIRLWQTWLVFVLLIALQVLLLFLSVDTSWRRRKPRRHAGVMIVTSAFLFALLLMGVIFSVCDAVPAIAGETGDFIDWMFTGRALALVWLPSWIFWAILLFLYVRGTSDRLTRLLGWVIKGSVVELLIAVPCHLIARQRTDCCAGAGGAIGIATGLAVMLAAFGPAVLLLYQQRLERLRPNSPVPRG